MNRDGLGAELARLNDAAEAAIKARREWIDAHLADFAKYPIGTTLVNRETGAPVGKVRRHYRVNSNVIHERESMHIDYEIDCGGNYIDNTSRQPGQLVSRQEYVELCERRLEFARAQLL